MQRPILGALQLEGEVFSLDIPSYRTIQWAEFFGSLNRPRPGVKWLAWRGFDILFQLRFCKEMKALPWSQIFARSLPWAEPPFARSSLSHFPRRRATWNPIGLKRLQNESFASVPFACEIRSWATVVGGNKLMTKSMTGSRFAA